MYKKLKYIYINKLIFMFCVGLNIKIKWDEKKKAASKKATLKSYKI